MLNNILEISKRSSKGGRVKIKIALLKIHDDSEETNKNGLHWKEEYVQNALDSIKLMPICVSFCDDDKKTPYDHGFTGEEIGEDGIHEPVFENSETVGSFEYGAIETVNIDGIDTKVLCGYGVLFNQRYPYFVKWVRENYALNKVDTSIEIMGLPSNDNKIVYEEENPTDEYRTPKEFVFSGSAILSVSPADDNAIVLEVAQKQERQKEENKNMEFTIDDIKTTIQTTISELNNKESELTQTINELNEQLTSKDSEIAEKDSTISELNASIEKLNKALDELKQEHDTYWEERRVLEEELVKAKVAERLRELDSELEEFSEEEKELVSENIEKLKTDISACKNKEELNNVSTEINSIKTEIFAKIGQKVKDEETKRVSEQNASKEKEVKIEDIFSEVCEEEIEKGNEEIDIFA